MLSQPSSTHGTRLPPAVGSIGGAAWLRWRSDVAMAHVLAAECNANKNGSRYLLVANGDAGMMTVSAIQQALRDLYPG